MKILRSGTVPSRNAHRDGFTGQLRIDALFNASAPGRVQGEGGPVKKNHPGDVVCFAPGGGTGMAPPQQSPFKRS